MAGCQKKLLGPIQVLLLSVLFIYTLGNYDYGDYDSDGDYEYDKDEEYGYEKEEDEKEEEYEYDDGNYIMNGINCEDGFIIPLWPGTDDLSIGDRMGRGLLYTLVLLYLMLGIAIYLNKMMESMETITSLMKRTSVPDPETGKNQVIIVKIWNQTVANMFMVLGSSSPLIFLCIIEIFAKGFNAGDLGPSTVIGSSAFHLLIVVGVIISSVPSGQVRKVKNLWALVLIAVWSLILYPWLFCMISFVSYGEVHTWEALVTLVLFIMILISIIAVTATAGNITKHEAAITEYNANFQLYKLLLEKMCTQYPGISDNTVLKNVANCGVCRRPKSWAYYLTQATNKISGRCVPQVPERSACMKKENEATTTFDKNGEGVSVTKIINSDLEEELQTKVDSILLRANSRGTCNSNLWIQLFKNLVSLEHLGGCTPGNLIIHILTWPWKLLAALIPPAALLGGFIAFVMSSIAIFLLTSVLCDIAGQLGCFILCKDILTGFILLSIGLNIPNLVAAKLAAAEEETDDLPLIWLLAGNCFTTSLGFGLSWLLGSIYWEAQGQLFYIPVGSLGFCITSFFFFGLIAFIVLFSQRCCSGGELGGNLVCKVITTIAFFIFWVIRVLCISMEAYGYIKSGL